MEPIHRPAPETAEPLNHPRTMALGELLARYRPRDRDGSWTWADEERDVVFVRDCLCCGVPGHYQAQLEAHIAEHGLDGMGVCLGDNGQVWDGHHRIVAARRLGIDTIPIESRQEADARWLRDHGPVPWEERRFGDIPQDVSVQDEELQRLRALTAQCSCATTYATYEGPEPDCPVHGAVRGLSDATRKLAKIRDLCDAQGDYVMVYALRRILDGEANGG